MEFIRVAEADFRELLKERDRLEERTLALLVDNTRLHNERVDVKIENESLKRLLRAFIAKMREIVTQMILGEQMLKQMEEAAYALDEGLKNAGEGSKNAGEAVP